MRKSGVLTGIVGIVLLGGILWYGNSVTRTEMVVPVLREDGTIGAEKGRRLSLFASVIRDVYNVPGLVVRVFSLQEMRDGNVRIRSAATEDFISFYCPSGTNTPAYAVLGSAPEFFSARKTWAWGGYIGNEGARLEAGESPNVIFDQQKFLGNEAARERQPDGSYRFPFIGNKANFTAGASEERYVASGSPPAGQNMIIDCGDNDGDGLSNRYEDRNWNGIVDTGETDKNDADTDDDGLGDGEELTGQGVDLDGDRRAQTVVTNPLNRDTDGDGVQDGTELSRTTGIPDTNPAIFVPDADPLTSTNPIVADTDAGGVSDGAEDPDFNGKVDPVNCETNPKDPADDPMSCGDGTIQSCGRDRRSGTADDEVCDDGPLNGQPNKCNLTCTGRTSASCGNGIIEPPEACDDGPQNGQPNKCNTSCTGTTASACGNGIVEAGEPCDDGNTCSGDGNWCGRQGDPPSGGQADCDGRNAGTCGRNDALDDTTDGCANCAIVEPYVCIARPDTRGPRSDCDFGAPAP